MKSLQSTGPGNFHARNIRGSYASWEVEAPSLAPNSIYFLSKLSVGQLAPTLHVLAYVGHEKFMVRLHCTAT